MDTVNYSIHIEKTNFDVEVSITVNEFPLEWRFTVHQYLDQDGKVAKHNFFYPFPMTEEDYKDLSRQLLTKVHPKSNGNELKQAFDELRAWIEEIEKLILMQSKKRQDIGEVKQHATK